MKKVSAIKAPITMTAKELDQTARIGGTIYIWWQIIGSVLTVLMSVAVVVYFAAFYRRGFETVRKPIDAVSCTQGTEQTCQGGNNSSNRTCTTKQVENCVLSIDGYPSMEKSYPIAPTVGEEVEVYANPSDPKSATLQPPLPTTIIILVTVGVAIVSAVWGALAYAFRNNKDAQRLGAVVGAIDLIKS